MRQRLSSPPANDHHPIGPAGFRRASDTRGYPIGRTATVLIRNARHQAWAAIRELKHLDRRLSALGCLNAHVHFKRRLNRQGEPVITNMMYLLEPRDRSTRKRSYTYIGIDQARQQDALARIERFSVRQRLRARIVQLKQTFRTAERELATALAIYRALAVQAKDCTREFAAHGSLYEPAPAEPTRVDADPAASY